MSFENTSFEAKVATTMATLTKLDVTIQNVGKTSGLSNIEADANKVTLQGPMSALDKLKAKLGVTNAGTTFNDMERASDRVTLDGPMSALDKLKQKLGMTNAGSTFSDMEGASQKVSFSALTSAIDGIGSHFSALTVAAGVALGGLVTQVASKAGQLAKSLTLDPITGGLQEYATNLNSIQTILANTQSQGANLQDVNSALQQLNKYSDQTIYNFSEMARNIGTFTAAGVKLQPAVDAIKGIANLAALSGSNSQQASTAMYQLSQAIAAGKVNLQDWNSVVNAGMGGEVFQKALFNTAKAMGTLTGVPVGQTFEEWKKAGNSFRQSLSATQKAATDGTSAIKTAQQNAAKAVSDAQKSAADATEQAATRVKDAQDGVTEATKQGARDVADAVRAQTDTVKQSAEDVRSALDGVREARKRLAEAMKPPSKDELQAAADNLKTAQLDQADLADAVTQAQQEQTRASEDLATAQAKLTSVQAAGGSAADIQAAQRAVEDAQKRVTDSADAQTRARIQQRAATRDVDQAEKDLQATREKGTKKDQNVKDAQDALTDATQKYKDAQVKAQQDIASASDKVADARRKSVESQQKAGTALAKAEKDQAETIKEAQEKVGEAHKQAAAQINAARDSISKKGPDTWLTSDVLTRTLQQFTGDMSDAQLKAQGFTDEQIKSIQATAKTAKASATEVKTLGQVFDVAKETIGSGWSQTFQTIFGNFTEAKGTFTGLSNEINGFINTNSNARNQVLSDWKALGGRTVLIDGITNAFEALGSIVKPIHDAFREIFPAKTGKDLYDLTVRFRDLMENFKIGPETAEGLKRTFAGFFAVLHIGWTIVKDVAKVIADLLGVAEEGSGGFLAITGAVGDFFVALDEAISKGKGLEGFFTGLEGILKVPIQLLGQVAHLIAGLFGGDSSSKAKGVSDSMSTVSEGLKPLAKVLPVVSDAWDHLMGIFDKVADRVGPALQGIGDAISNFTEVIANAFQNANFDTVFAAIQTTLIGGIFLAIKKGLGGGVGVDFGGGMLENLSKSFEALTGNLKAMQQNIQAGTLLKIAAAIGILAAGIAVLASIDPEALTRAMTAVAVGLGELVGALALLSKFAGGTSFVTMPLIAGSLVLLATAVTILAGATKIFATMSWEDIIKGLTGVAGVLVAVGAGVKLIGPDVLVIGPGLLAIAVAMNVLAVAVKIFSDLSWEELAKGLIGVGGALTAIGIGLVGIGPEILLIGPGLVATAIALTLLSGAVASFGSMDLKTLGLGILGIAGALVAIGLSIQAIPPTVALQAAGLVILAVALTGIAGAIALMGNLAIGTLVKGITAMGAALVVLGIGLTAMAGTLPGSAALLAAAAALAILAPAIGLLGTMKWETIFKGLASIALVLGTLAVVGTVASSGLVALGVALLPLGAAMVLVAGSVYLFAKAIQIMGDEGGKAVAAVIVALTALVAVFPKIVIDFLKGLVSIVESVAKIAPPVLLAIGTMLDAIIAFVIKEAPKLAVAVTALITTILTVINQNSEGIIQAGLTLLTNLLSGIASNIGQVTTQIAAIITEFLTSLTNSAPQLVQAGLDALTAFLKGIADNLANVVTSVADLITKFIGAVGSKLEDIAKAGADLMVKFLGAIASYEQKLITGGVNVILNFFTGIGRQIPKIIDKGVEVVGKLLQGISKALVKLTGKGADAVINFLNGMADTIRTKGPELRAAGYNVADALIDGIWQGIEELGHKVVEKLGALVRLLPGSVKKILGISSPSKVFQEIGENTMAGLSKGIDKGADGVNKTMSVATSDILDTASTTLGKVPDALGKMTDIQPTITPVVDLSNVKAGARDVDRMLGGSPQFAYASTVQASAIASTPNLSAGMLGGGERGPLVTFEQNNYSPESLTPTEVYRQTNNQLSQIKQALGFVSERAF
jgi:tape measure domain-containing protein